MPFTTLRQVNLAVNLPSVKQKAIAELGYGTSGKLAVPYRERIWRSRYGSTISIYTDLDFQNTWESARYSTLPGGWVTDLRGGQAGVALANDGPEAQAQKLTDDLERIFPGINQVERGRGGSIGLGKRTLCTGFLMPCYLPGQWTPNRRSRS